MSMDRGVGGGAWARGRRPCCCRICWRSGTYSGPHVGWALVCKRADGVGVGLLLETFLRPVALKCGFADGSEGQGPECEL